MLRNRNWFVILLSVLLGGCAAIGGPVQRGNGIDQAPMYGGMDRQAVPQLKEADEQFITGTTKEFGTREKASDAFVDQGIRYYKENNYAFAMRRFNQAWLLNPQNADSFWGFGMVYHDEGKVCEAKEMIDRAISLKLAKPIALADAGRIYTLCGVSNQSLGAQERQQYFATSEDLYKRADMASPNNDYVHGSWATAYYWRGDYVRSWEQVAKARSLGFVFPERFLNLLRDRMSEPKD
jgi:tetratricopeptide (TPR) repeat protein